MAFGKSVVNFTVSQFMRHEPGAAGLYVQGYPVRAGDVLGGMLRTQAERAREAAFRKGMSAADQMKSAAEAVVHPVAGFVSGVKLRIDSTAAGVRAALLDRGGLVDRVRMAERDAWTRLRMPVIFVTSEEVRKRVEDFRRNPVSAALDLLPTEVLMPSLGDAGEKSSVVTSFVKRLGAKIQPPSQRLCELLDIAARHICERVEPGEPLTRERLHVEASQKADSEPWTPQQRAEYIHGAGMAWSIVEGSVSPKELSDAVHEYGFFVKNETYPSGELKALRFIVCPSHFVRGLMFAMFHGAEKQILKVLHKVTVKGLTRAEQLEKTDLVCRGAGHVASIDLTCFEQTVSGIRQAIVETQVYAQAAPVNIRSAAHRLLTVMSGFYNAVVGRDEQGGMAPCWQDYLSDVFESCSANVTRLSSKLGHATTPIIRRSGELKTSVGNLLQNFCGEAAIASVSRFGDRAANHIVDVIAEMLDGGMGLVEGDDSVWDMRVFGNDPKRLEQAAEQLGIPIKLDVTEPAQAHFLSALQTEGRRVRSTVYGLMAERFLIRDPMELLSKVFAIFTGPGAADTVTSDLELAAAKVLSYLQDYVHLPLVGPVLVAFWKRYGYILCARLDRMRMAWRRRKRDVLRAEEHVRDLLEETWEGFKDDLFENGPDPVSRYLLKDIFGFREDDLRAILELSSDEFQEKLDSFERTHDIGALRLRVQECTGITQDQQQAIERDLQLQILNANREDVKDGPLVFVLPKILGEYGLRTAASRMKGRLFPGVREHVSRVQKQIQSQIDFGQVSRFAGFCFGKILWLLAFAGGAFAFWQASMIAWWMGLASAGMLLSVALPVCLVFAVVVFLLYGGDLRRIFFSGVWITRIVVVSLAFRFIGRKVESTQWWRNLPSPELRRWCSEAGYEWPGGGEDRRARGAG
jgi:hypothetical protein